MVRVSLVQSTALTLTRGGRRIPRMARERSLCCLHNPPEDRGQITLDLLVAHSKNSDTSQGEHSLPLPIVLHLRLVDSAVHLDGEPRGVAVEVEDEPVDHLLAAE